MGFDAIEAVFVTGSAAAEGGLGPSADFDARMGADYCVPLLRKSDMGRGGDGDHFLKRRRNGRGVRGGCEIDW